MGHTPEVFKQLLDSNRTDIKGPSELKSITAERCLDLGKALINAHEALQNNTTHCFAFAREFLGVKSESFQQLNLNFDIDGLVALYHCIKDNRTYMVKITTER